MIYKVVPETIWRDALVGGLFYGSPDDVRDGFIHLSAGDQLSATLEKHFRGKTALLLVAFEENDLLETLKWEPSRGGALFPHNYGPLKTSLAVWAEPLHLGEDDVPVYAEGLVPC